MNKLNSVEELYDLRDRVKKLIKVRIQGEEIENMTSITVFMGNGGIEAGAKTLFHYFFDTVEKKNLDTVVVMQGDVAETEGENPMVKVTQPNKEPLYFSNVTETIADEIINKYA